MVMGGLILAAVAFFVVFGALLADQLAQLISSLPEVLATVARPGPTPGSAPSWTPTQILNNFGLGAKDIANIAQNLGVGLLSVLGTAVNWVFSLFTIMLFSFYFAADGPQLPAHGGLVAAAAPAADVPDGGATSPPRRPAAT